jgi:hypothetical protein
VGIPLKEITWYRDAALEFDTTLWKLQLIDFAGLTSPLSAVEPEVHTNQIAFPTDADEASIEGGHDGIHVPHLQSNSGRPFDTDVHDEVSTLRKHSFQGEARRTF